MPSKNTEQSIEETLEEFQDFAQKLAEAPAVQGFIIGFSTETTIKGISTEKYVVVTDGGGVTHCGQTIKKLKLGARVAVVQGAVVATLKGNGLVTVAARVIKVLSKTERLVELDSVTKIVYDFDLDTEVGDQVLVASGTIITDIMSKGTTVAEEDFVPVEWESIGGLDDVKEQFLEFIVGQTEHAHLYTEYGYKVPKGILLEGPPGCGKTMIGKAAATEVAKLSGGNGKFIYVKGPEILNKYVGESERNIRNLFSDAREHHVKTGVQAIIFIDEAESVLGRRGANHTSGMDQTIVPTFLTEMDGLQASSAVVILATNMPHHLDPAVVRDGRIDRKITVGRPDESTFEKIIDINLAGTKSNTCGKKVARHLYDENRRVLEVLLDDGQTTYVTARDVLSGASAANIVEIAKTTALKRDIKAGAKKPSGVGDEDLMRAADRVLSEMKITSHQTEAERAAAAMGCSMVEYRAVA